MIPPIDAAEPTPNAVQAIAVELRRALRADAGIAVYLNDADGDLRLAYAEGSAATRFEPRRRPSGRFGLHWIGDEARPVGATLLVPIPDIRGGFIFLARSARQPFTPGERSVAGVYARQLATQLQAVDLERRWSVWARHLETIQRIGQRLARLSTEEEVGLAICTETKQVIDYHNCRVYRLEPNGADLTPIAFRGEISLYAGETTEALRCTVGEGLTGLVAQRGEPLIVDDAANDPRAVEIPGTEAIIESMLLVPLRYDERVTGVIVLSKLGYGQFGADDLRLLEILADQAAVALENARLLAGRDELLSELRALLEITQSHAEASDEGTLARNLARKMTRAADVEHCTVSRWDEGTTILRTLGEYCTAGASEAGDLTEFDLVDFPATRSCLRDRRPVVIQADDPAGDPAERALMRRLGQTTLVLLPLVTGSLPVGLVELSTHRAERRFTAAQLSFFLTMANHAGIALENARLVERLRRQADIDQVTGLVNHRHLQERLAQEVARAGRTGAPLAIALLDLDGFKGVNDRFGHVEGDVVLREVASTLRLSVRTNDIVARYGGDEFVVVMPDTGGREARAVAERVIEGIRARSYPLTDGTELRLAASAGLAVYPDDGRTSRRLLERADRAMYTVKDEGGGGLRRGVEAALRRPPPGSPGPARSPGRRGGASPAAAASGPSRPA